MHPPYKLLILIGLFAASCPAQQYGGLIGLVQRKMNKPPAPNTTVKLVGENVEVSPDPHNHVGAMTFFLILENGAKATASCFLSTTSKQCGIEPVVAETRHASGCMWEGRTKVICFPAETYKAYRSGNQLIVFNASGPSYMDVQSAWNELVQGWPEPTPPSQPLWTAVCNDDSISYSQDRSGTCSDHQGVKQWREAPKE